MAVIDLKEVTRGMPILGRPGLRRAAKRVRRRAVEASPDLYARCVRERPRSRVFHCALAAPEQDGTTVTVTSLDLVSTVAGAWDDPGREADHLAQGDRTQAVRRRVREVPARTLSSVLDEAGIERIDLLSLDVEGYEVPALRGLDLSCHRPRVVLVETLTEADADAVADVLGDAYERRRLVSPQDTLFVAR